MSETESFLEQERQKKLFRDTDVRQLSLKMLDISDTNRIVTEKQAKMLLVLRSLHARLSGDIDILAGKPSQEGDRWAWLSNLADMFEKYQLTCGEPENSRKAFIEALKVELQTQEVKKRSIWTGV